MTRTVLALTIVVAMSAGAANAVITTDFVKINGDPVDIGGSLFNVYEMVVDASTDWTNSRLDVNLTVGEMFASPFGGIQEPTAALKAALTDLEFDTWLTVPGGGGADQVPIVLAGDIIMPTSAGQKTQIGASWGNTDTTDIGVFSIAQITISANDPAEGTITGRSYDVDSAGVGVEIVDPDTGNPFRIEGGQIVPEPVTLSLLCLGLPLLRRRR